MTADIEKTRDELAVELFDLREHIEQPYLTEERKAQIRRRMAVVSFELEYKGDQVD